MDPALLECYLWVSQSAVRATKLRECAEALGVTGTMKRPAGRWLSRDHAITRFRTSRPALAQELRHDSREAEQKARAQGLLKIVTCFKFVCTLYFLSDVMTQLTIFCKQLQSKTISLEGVLNAYAVTRDAFQAYRADIKNMPYLKRFVVAALAGTVDELKLPTLAAPGQDDYRGCVAQQLKEWDNSVRVPFLGHTTQLLFEKFGETEPTMRALLHLATPR